MQVAGKDEIVEIAARQLRIVSPPMLHSLRLQRVSKMSPI